MLNFEEDKELAFKKLTKTQQKKLSLQEQINYLKQEQEYVLEEAKRKQNELKLQQQKLLSEAKAQERKNDTRRKILLGAWVMDKLKNDREFNARYVTEFEDFLTNDSKKLEHIQKDLDLFANFF